jgi:hypothetical protein
MTNDDSSRPTWDGDALAEAVGRELGRRDDAAAWTHEAFLEWLGAEMRARTERRTSSTRSSDLMLRRGRELHARVLARQCRVGLIGGPPPLVTPPRPASPSDAMEEALAMGAVARVDLAAAAGVGRELWDEPAEQWVALPAGAPRMRAIALRIDGESMAPLLHTGDTVLVELGPALVRGAVVVARRPDHGYVCKRVERLGRREVLLGSLNPEYDAVTIPRDDRLIVGTVRLVWRA